MDASYFQVKNLLYKRHIVADIKEIKIAKRRKEMYLPARNFCMQNIYGNCSEEISFLKPRLYECNHSSRLSANYFIVENER